MNGVGWPTQKLPAGPCSWGPPKVPAWVGCGAPGCVSVSCGAFPMGVGFVGTEMHTRRDADHTRTQVCACGSDVGM